MFDDSLSNSGYHQVHRDVARPDGGYLKGVCDVLASLVLPKPLAYIPRQYTTDVNHFLLEPGEVLHPTSFEASVRRLYCYSARYADGAGSVLFIVGWSVSQAIAECDLPEVLASLGECSRRHGGISDHILACINTPLSQSHLYERGALVRSREHLRGRLVEVVRSDVVPPPPLDVVNVHLLGLSPDSRRPCRCVFEGSADDAGIALRVQWGWTDKQERRVSLIGRSAESPSDC